MDEYFRSLFIVVEPVKDLIELRQALLEAFGSQDSTDYLPHLSLLYGQFPRDVKREMIEAIAVPVDVSARVESVHIVHASSTMDVTQWQRLEELRLGHNKRPNLGAP